MALEIGWKTKNKYKEYVTIIAIRDENDIDVKFEDGTIIEHITYHKLLMRGFNNPNKLKPRVTFERVKQAFENKGYILLSEKYEGARAPLKYICPKHPDQVKKITWLGIQQGRGCRECGYEKVSKDLSVFRKTGYNKIQRLCDEANIKLTMSEEEYLDPANSSVKFVCGCSPDLIQIKTLTAFLQTPHCSRCFKNKRGGISREEGFKEFCQLCEEKGYILKAQPSDYINCTTPLTYECTKHGKQKTSLAHLREGKGCRICGHETVGEKLRLSQKEAEEKIRKQELILISPYTCCEDYHSFSCVHHPEVNFNARFNDISSGKISCPACNESLGEKKIRLWLDEKSIKYEPQKKFSDLYRFSDRNKLSYDFYIPSTNTLIEYQGQFHDGTAWQQSEKCYEQQKIKDKMKKDYAISNGYNFLEIWYWDFYNAEQILEKELI